MIFDEIDRGVGGAVASAVGERLARLAQASQVLVVTHSPQVAARATHHYRIEKSHGAEGTRTTVRRLNEPGAARRDRAHAVGLGGHRRSAGPGGQAARGGMTAYVALLRAVNVGGRQLAMADLRRIAGELGLADPTTFIASGNLLFASGKKECELEAALETAIEDHMGKPVGVMVRTAKEMAAVAAANPFADQPGNRVVAIFLDDRPPRDSASAAKNAADERVVLGRREIYVHYPSGQGRSKLRIPAAASWNRAQHEQCRETRRTG